LGGVPTAMKIARADRAGQIGREAQPSFADVLADDLVEAGLVDRDLALVEGVDLLDVDIDTDHVVAEVGEAGAGHEAHVARSDDCDVHWGVSSGQGLARRRGRRARGILTPPGACANGRG
jgi:hypothetical protein